LSVSTQEVLIRHGIQACEGELVIPMRCFVSALVFVLCLVFCVFVGLMVDVVRGGLNIHNLAGVRLNFSRPGETLGLLLGIVAGTPLSAYLALKTWRLLEWQPGEGGD
jgi:hypothetical protein